MHKGTITYWKKTFGFITTTTGQRYFFHASNFAKGQHPVLEGQVEFQVGAPIAVGKALQAINVRYIQREESVVGGGQ